jgi:hypothetical protein
VNKKPDFWSPVKKPGFSAEVDSRPEVNKKPGFWSTVKKSGFSAAVRDTLRFSNSTADR